MISFSCLHCGKRYNVQVQLGRKKAKCRKCGQTVIIPADPASAEAPFVISVDAVEIPAKLVVFRQQSDTASMYEVTLTVDGQAVGQLNENDKLTITVHPGEHTVEVRGGSLRRSQVISVDAAQVLKF